DEVGTVVHRGGKSLSEARFEGNCLSQQPQVLVAYDDGGAERCEMSREKLHVKKPRPDASQVFDELGERYFGRVGLAVEHGLRRKESSDRDPVGAAHEAFASPDLYAVRPAELVERDVGRQDRRSDPGPLTAIGTSLHHAPIGSIKSDSEPASPSRATQAAG